MDESWSAQLLDTQLRPVRPLGRVKSGTLTWSQFQAVAGGGNLEIDLTPGQDIDWLSSRIAVRHNLGDRSTTVGVYLPAAPSRRYEGTGVSTSIALLDGTETLNHPLGKPYSLPAGTGVAAAIDAILAERTGWPSRAVEADPTLLLRTALTWEPDATWLTVANDLCKLAGYGAIYADPDGVLTARRYVEPARRPLVAAYGAESRAMLPTYTDEADLWGVPTTIHVVSQGTTSTPPIHATAQDDDPASPFSVPSRGRVIARLEQAEVASQAAAVALAKRRLDESRQITRRATVTHPLDHTRLGDVVCHDPLGFMGPIVERSIRLGIGPVVTDTIRRFYRGGERPWT